MADTTEPMNPEQAADLAALQAGAQEGAAQPATAQPAAPQFNLEDDIAGMMVAALAVLSKPLPSLAEIYTEPVIAAASEAVARVCNKRGWLQNGFGQYSEEIAAGMILLPLAYATYSGVKGDIKRAKIKAGKADTPGAAEPVDSPKTVVAGTVIPQ